MAAENEVKYTRNVPAPEGNTADLPQYTQKEIVQPQGTPSISSSFRELGSVNNFTSTLGNKIASTASTELSNRLGNSYGKNPSGNLFPPITEFDKTFAASYKTQAQATLGLQANSLITRSNIELSKANRMTPELISKSQHDISVGLQNIYSHAPDEVRTQLESQYGAVQINQYKILNDRMLREQTEQQRNTTMRFSSEGSINAYNMALHGQDKEAESVEESVKQINDITSKRDLSFDPKIAAANVKDVRVARLTGRYTRMGLEAEKDGKLEEFLKDLSNRPADVPEEDYQAVSSGVYNYFNHKQMLKNQYESLQDQKMHNQIARDPNIISKADWEQYSSNVSRQRSSQMEFNLIQALKTKQQEGLEVNNLLRNYESPEAHANASDKVKNSAFNDNVDYVQKSNPNISHEEAQVQVASSAGAEVPVYTKQLKNQLWSGDPYQMQSAALAIDSLQTNGNGHALTGLNDQDRALFSDIKHNLNPADPSSSARMIIENSQNLDPEIKKVTDSKWNDLVFNNTNKENTTVDQWILNKFGLQGGLFHHGFDSPFMATVYAADIQDTYHTNYINTRGDDVRATEMTEEYIKQHYGQTMINGDKAWTMNPIEKLCGFSVGDGVDSIHADFIRQIGEPMSRMKESFNQGLTDEYWSVEMTNPKELQESKSIHLSRSVQKLNPLQMVQYTRQGISTNMKRFPLVLIGTNFGQWEINVQTEHGPRSIFLEAPQIGVSTYKPNVKWIQDEYMGRSHNFPNEKYGSQIKSLLTPKPIEGQNG